MARIGLGDSITDAPSIKRLGAEHGQAYVAHLLRPSKDDRRLRFAHPAHDKMVVRSVERTDGDVTALHGGVIRGVVHLAWPNAAFRSRTLSDSPRTVGSSRLWSPSAARPCARVESAGRIELPSDSHVPGLSRHSRLERRTRGRKFGAAVARIDLTPNVG